MSGTLSPERDAGSRQPAAPASPAPAFEQQAAPAGAATSRHQAALAAGCKALYVATGRFTAGISEERLTADVFDGTPMGTLMAGLKAVIDEQAKTVSVTHAEGMPPRIAAWRPVLGSTQLPIGATADAVSLLPSVPAEFGPPDTDDLAWPAGDRDALGPAQPALDELVRAAFDPSHYGGITWGVAILQGGRILAERYGRGMDMHTPHRTNSAAKSLAATVIGVALRHGLVDLRGRPCLPEWSRPGDPRGRITIEDLLHMNSGLYTEAAGSPQPELYYGGAAAAERAALNTVDSMPGTRWVYSGSDTILAVRAVRAALRDDPRHLRFPFEEILWKIGMTRTTPEVDWNGDFLMSGDMWSTVRDLARFALLYASDGVWNGERIVPEGWSRYVATQAPAQPKSADRRGYGAQFWLFGPAQGLPEGCYTPDGARGQYAMIVPAHDLIIVRRGFDLVPGFDIARFTREVIAALEP